MKILLFFFLNFREFSKAFHVLKKTEFSGKYLWKTIFFRTLRQLVIDKVTEKDEGEYEFRKV